MSPTQLFEKLRSVKPQKIGKNPVVVLPLADWRAIEDILEEREMRLSKSYAVSILEARRQVKAGKTYALNLIR